ncbi:transposase family protein [Streptomyces sp. NPDC127051]|uniref:transposase family protein n=1 Tax=Streptomyces sp. NPDC127051 TaxID=3347119 RepID=UPI003648B758
MVSEKRGAPQLEVLTDKGCTGTAALPSPPSNAPGTELPDKHKKSNKAHAALRAPVERTISRIRACIES